MAMIFTSENVEVPADTDREIVSIDFYQDVLIPSEDGDESVNMRIAALEMSEDQAVELATLLLMGATKLRAERLAGSDTPGIH